MRYEIEDQRDNPINIGPRPESTRLDDIRDACAEQRYRLLHPGPVAAPRPGGPIAQCMARHAARVKVEREMFDAVDSMWQVPA